MAVRKIGASWWVDLRFDRTRYRKRSPENTRTGALAYESTLRRKLAHGEGIAGKRNLPKPLNFAEFAPNWFDEYVVPNNKPSEQHQKKCALSASLIPFFGKSPISAIGVRDIERYKAAQIRAGMSQKTINNRLAILRKCLHTAYEWLEFPGAPPKVQWLKCPPPRTDYLSSEECELLLQHSSGIIREMILAALRTGMRQGELKGLQWTSVDWANRSVTVRHSRSDYTKSLDTTKTNRERHIPLDIDLFEVLDARKCEEGYIFLDNGEPFTHKRLSAALTKVYRRAGLRKITWHVLRHTFATHLAMNGTPLHVVQALLGHTTIAMTTRYAHVVPSALRTAIELANPRSAGAANLGQPVGNRWQERQLQIRTAHGEAEKKQATTGAIQPGDLPLAA